MIATFLITALAISLSSQQQFPFQYYPRSNFWSVPYLPGWNPYGSFASSDRFNYEDNQNLMGRHYYNRPLGPQFAIQDLSWNSVVKLPDNKQNENDGWSDAQPRIKLGNRNRVQQKQQIQHEEDLEERNYYNTANVANSYNPFLKTVYFFTSATATTCVVSRCIPAAQFKDITAQNSICLRKRRNALIGLLESLDDGDESSNSKISETILASTVEKVEPTTVPVEGSYDEAASLPASVKNQLLLASSKDETGLGEASLPPIRTSSRTKRFFKNFFAVSSTVTIYTFVTSTYLSKLQLASDSSITCRPSDIGIC